jgi:hypothetical protein
MGINRAFGLFISAALAAAATVVLMESVIIDDFNPLRLLTAIGILILLHALRFPRLLFCREAALYAVFLGYMSVSLLWTPNAELGLNTLIPALDFLLILILFGSLVTYHDPAAVLVGSFSGFVIAAVAYTRHEEFPFVWPEGFSYNAMAGMYLFGLLMTLLVGWYMRWRIVPLAAGSILVFLVAATTSIKTNLGLLIGVTTAALIYFRHFMTVLRRTAIVLAILGGAVVYAVTTNDVLQERMEGAFYRLSLGIGVLSQRPDTEVKGAGLGLQKRVSWKDQGIKGWLASPLLGLGVEGFRSDYGITSHSTPVDLLYNFGLIGLIMFYALFASITWRLWRARGTGLQGLCALMLAAVVCYGFMTISGTLYYNAFIAAFLGSSVALLMRHIEGVRRADASARSAHA